MHISRTNICVVTVTYGRRLNLLHQLLASLPPQGVGAAIVVDNGSFDDIQSLRDEFGDWVEVVRLDQNTGSANGFKVGIEAALAKGAEFVWLLDDDNVPRPETLAVLRNAFHDLLRGGDPSRLAVAGFRRDHQADVAAGLPVDRAFAKPDSFFGFHWRDIFFKVWRRLPTVQRRASPVALLPYMLMPFVTYSGLFVHRSLIEALGTPDPRFVLYCDDNEFTWRITRAGGKIWLVTGAEIDDLEASWNIKARFTNSIEGWLKGGTDLRAYYAARNEAYFEVHCRVVNSCTYRVNRFLYLKLMTLAARYYRAGSRHALLLRAIEDGTNGLLGTREEFRL